MAKTAFILAGTGSNVGKTTVTTAILHAFTQEGLTVQAFKCGPDYLDPTFHSFVTGVPSINLDLHLMSEEAVKASFVRHSQAADLVVIEGVMGLYDGWDHSFDNGSAAHMGRVLGVPVVLIVDGSGVSTSVAAMVKGYQLLDPRMALAGVIINQVSSQMHCNLLADAIKQYTGLPVLGYVPKQLNFSLESRHLGLKPAAEVADLKEQLDSLSQAVTKTLDFEALRNLKVDLTGLSERLQDGSSEKCSDGPSDKVSASASSESDQPPYRVAYALDEAFYFYYQDNLSLMKACGMELVPFSPIHDKELPPGTEALYLGGGYPELHAKALSENLPMRSAILGASRSGMPIYAECGGMMYLCNSMENMGSEEGAPSAIFEMVGALKGKAQMTERLQRFGYVEIELKDSCLLGNPKNALKGHEFHRSTVDWEPDQSLIYRVKKGYGSQLEWTCGAKNDNTLGAYAHIHFGNQPEVLKAWIDIIKTRRNSNG